MDGNIEKMQSLTGRIKGLGIDKTLTKKGMCAEAEAVGKALATKVSITDIVDDLTSVADDKPLSANQGRLLKKQIDEIDPHYAENVVYDKTNVKSALDDLKATIDELFVVETITGTTDSGGCLLTNIPYYYIPVSAIVTSHTHRECTFFVANNYHYIHIRDAIGSSNIANTEVTVKVYYINSNIMSHTNA